jgi:hypothetical protein
MYFGDHARFAFQCVIDWDTSKPDSYLFGHSCFWVDGVAVGDFSDSNILGVIITCLENFLDGQGKRSHSMLSGRLALEVLTRVTDDWQSNKNEFAHCLIFQNWGENFDSAPVGVLLEEGDHQRLIWERVQSVQTQSFTEAQEIQLPLGEFERVVRMFLEWYKDAEQKRFPRFGQGEAGSFYIP